LKGSILEVNSNIPGWVIDYLDEVKLYFDKAFVQNESRFPTWKKCVNRYNEKYDEVVSASNSSVRALEEMHNELCIADALLGINNPCIELIEYEPALPKCGKTIDYRCMSGSSSIYVDVKTITPKTVNAWDKYIDVKSKGLIAPNNEFILDPEYMGGEIWHSFTAARGRMLEYTLELEQKIDQAKIGVKNNIFLLAFCGDGNNWHLDQLEDFVHFYRIGQHRYDDGFSLMEKHCIQQKGIKFTRRISKFIYLERSLGYVKPKNIVWNVIPPRT
jgi:hypothetical protein